MKSEMRAGLQTAWLTAGEGPHPALFLHCSLASGRSLLPLMQSLSNVLECVAPDLPGHGQSGDWDGSGDYVARAADMAETFCIGPRDVIGHSLGGAVALTMMARRPELVRRAVLIEPVLFAAAQGTAAFEDHANSHGAVIEAMEDGDPDTATARFTDLWGTGQTWASIPPAERHAMAERMPLVRATEAALVDDTNGILREGVLEQIRVPILLVRGSETEPVIGEIHETLRKRLPNCSEVIVPGAGHMSPVTRVPQVKELIHDHIRRRNE